MLSETQKKFEKFFKNPLTNPKTFDIMYGSSRKINIGVSPSGKASDSDSDISGVRIPAPQPRKKTNSLVSWSFFNEAHLRCMKNEAGLRFMKCGFATRRSLCALRFMATKLPLHRSRKASASYSQSECFIDTMPSA